MVCRKTWILGAALCGAVLCGASSQAGSITFLATGTFTSSGTSDFTSPDGLTTVDYTSLVSTASPPPTNNVNLGTFTVASTDPTLTAVSDTFKLQVADIATGDTITFSGTMSGLISSSNSTASIVFSSPLTQTLDGFIVTIANHDAGVAGQVNLNSPTTNGGVSTINASVAIPEPASVVLLGLAVPALAGLGYRRSRR
jgi:hypothetical protein